MRPPIKTLSEGWKMFNVNEELGISTETILTQTHTNRENIEPEFSQELEPPRKQRPKLLYPSIVSPRFSRFKQLIDKEKK